MFKTIKHVFNAKKYYNESLKYKVKNEQLKVENQLLWDNIFMTLSSLSKIDDKDISDMCNHLIAVVHEKRISDFNKVCVNSITKISDKFNLLTQLKSLHVSSFVDETKIDVNKFKTKEYKSYFLKLMDAADVNDNELLANFNALLFEEKVYIYGLKHAIKYCKDLKNKNKAMYLQLMDYYFTEDGLKDIQLEVLSSDRK